MDWACFAAAHLCALFSAALSCPGAAGSSAGDQVLPEPAAALSPCTHHSLPDCTESTKEKKGTGSLAAVCVVYKASFAGFLIPLGQGCQVVPALLCCRAQGEQGRGGGEQDLSLRGGWQGMGTLAPQHPYQGVPVLESSQGCIFAAPL